MMYSCSIKQSKGMSAADAKEFFERVAAEAGLMVKVGASSVSYSADSTVSGDREPGVDYLFIDLLPMAAGKGTTPPPKHVPSYGHPSGLTMPLDAVASECCTERRLTAKHVPPRRKQAPRRYMLAKSLAFRPAMLLLQETVEMMYPCSLAPREASWSATQSLSLLQ